MRRLKDVRGHEQKTGSMRWGDGDEEEVRTSLTGGGGGGEESGCGAEPEDDD